MVCALHYLKSQLKVMHRDVKPSNILINRGGCIKICDFGISGHLVDSIAKTMDAGCKPYMAVSIRIYIYIYIYVVNLVTLLQLCLLSRINLEINYVVFLY